MSLMQTEYPARLPYGYWFDPETGEEHLFDRGGAAIASRPVGTPRAVTVHYKRKHISCPVKARFYNDGNSASRDAKMRAKCELILSRFILGHDVRAFLPAEERSRVPATGGEYLPLGIGGGVIARSLRDVIEGRPGAKLQRRCRDR